MLAAIVEFNRTPLKTPHPSHPHQVSFRARFENQTRLFHATEIARRIACTCKYIKGSSPRSKKSFIHNPDDASLRVLQPRQQRAASFQMKCQRAFVYEFLKASKSPEDACMLRMQSNRDTL
jgi:hypothetical protein